MENEINMDETLTVEKDINNVNAPEKEANTPSEIDTSWIDTFSDDYNNDTTATPVDVNDKRDRDDRDRETVTETETKYDPFDTSYFDTPADDYLKEAQSNVQDWSQKAREDAMAGMQLAYNDEDLKKHIKNIGDIEYKEPNWFERTLGGALPKDVVDNTLDMYKQSIVNSMNDSKARPMKELSSDTKFPDAIEKARKEYDEAMKKAQDIEANGKTVVPGISAEQERARISNAIEEIKKASERGDAASVRQLLDNLNKMYGSSTASKDLLQSANDSRDNLVDRAEEVKNPKPAETPRTETPRTTPAPTPTATTSDAVTNEFNDMFANPNVDSLEDYKSEPATTPEPPAETEPSDPNAPIVQKNGMKWAPGMKVIGNEWSRDPDTGIATQDVPNGGESTATTASTTSPEDTDRDSRIQLHNDELNNFLPVEIINTNPENVNGVAEALANNDTDTAEYLLANSLSGNNFMQLIESATLGNKTVSPELMAVLQSIWAKLQSGQSVGAINSADLSNVSRERSDAITKAFNNYNESSLKDLDYYSRDTNATDESAYNKGLTENTNEVVSDVMKKYVIANPWIIKAISKWK